MIKFSKHSGVGLHFLIFVLWNCIAPAEAANAPFDRFVVFGTSLSDPGNYFALSHLNNTPPYTRYVDSLLIPSAAYSVGGHHLSNGSTWIEQLARPLGLEHSTGPAFANSGGATNYAVDGARAHEDGLNVNLQEQVNRFSNDVSGAAPPSALYVIEMGSNDVLDVLAFGNPALISQAVTSIYVQLERLYAMGARHFLVWDVPDISKTPTLIILSQVNPGAKAAALAATLGFNAALGSVLTGFQTAHPGVDVKVFDAFDGTDAIISDPVAYGLTVVDQACITPGAPPFQCADAGHHLFWDGIHPTKAGHAITAKQVSIVLGL